MPVVHMRGNRKRPGAGHIDSSCDNLGEGSIAKVGDTC